MDVETVIAQAAQAAFFKDSDGTWYRILVCEEEGFEVEDEDTGELYTIQYSTIQHAPAFYKIVPIE